ncbi:A/G-specific adenine glycosylase [Myroides sp. LJL119]
MSFSNKLITWYLQNKRPLPWRKTRDPYAIWLSEIILQQTKVVQGTPYYLAFLNTFPSVFQLADASEDQVMRLWQGLGYYSRARNLHATAKIIANKYKGEFPNTYKELLTLPGIGPYTAAAIASIAFNEQVAVLDGNVFRVLSRIYGITTDISSSQGKKEFQELAQSLIPANHPATFNQAIMDFGAIHCTPKQPLCTQCCFFEKCIALQTNQVNNLPVKLSKTKVTNRYLDFIIFIDPENQTHIEQRINKDIWKKLYQFPVIEHDNKTKIDIQDFLKQDFPYITTTKIELLTPQAIRHILSHQRLYINFWRVYTNELLNNAVRWEDLPNFGFPIVIHNFISKL